jgi:16S rRNA (cytosine1402-N4)-methyltransferase
MAGSEVHIPVLAEEVLHWLQIGSSQCYIDGTLGLGGHTELILQQTAPAGRVLGFEWDEQAAVLAAERLSRFGSRFKLVPASYADIPAECVALGIEQVDGILVDLGVSSLQLDSPERGFSFKFDAPLDMRMDIGRQRTTAAMLVNRLKKDELADIFYNYGEERQARRIARFIVAARIEKPLATTAQLAEVVRMAVPLKYHPKKIHVATRVFQALRIAVNRELDNLVALLERGTELLRPGARMCIITFHSLEDRIVKQAFVRNPAWKVLTRKPVVPTAEEVKENSRARSAKLRVAEKI